MWPEKLYSSSVRSHTGNVDETEHDQTTTKSCGTADPGLPSQQRRTGLF